MTEQVRFYDVNRTLNFVPSALNCRVYEQMAEVTGCDYPITAHRMCEEYLQVQSSFREDGQIFFQDVRERLQINAINNMFNTNSCDALREQSIQGHRDIYLNGQISFFALPLTDQFRIFWHAEKNWETVGTMYDILKEYPSYVMGNEVNVFNSSLYLQARNIQSLTYNNSFQPMNGIEDSSYTINLVNYELSLVDNLMNIIPIPIENIQTGIPVENSHPGLQDENLPIGIPIENPIENNPIENNNLSDQTLTAALTTVNKTLDVLNHMVHSTEREKVLYISSLFVDHIKNNLSFMESSDDGMGAFINVASSFLKNGKLKFDQLLMEVCQQKFNIPLNGVREFCVSLFHGGNNIMHSFKTMYKDLVLYEVPYAQVVLLVYQAVQMIKTLYRNTHVSIVNINGFTAIRTENKSFNFSKGDYYVIKLDNEVLDIHVKESRSKKSDGDKYTQKKFKEETIKKAFQVYGIDYEFFENKKDDTELSRFDKYKQMCYFKLTHQIWLDAMDLTDEQKTLYDHVLFESEEEKEKRITFKILEKKMKYLDLNENKDIVTFLVDLKNDLMKCKNNTELAEFAYSFFYETGNSNDEQYHFSDLSIFLLEIFNINIEKLESYINHEKNMTDDQKKKAIEKEKEKEQQQLDKLLITLRKITSQTMKDQINKEKDKSKKAKNDNTGDYTREEIIKFAHKQLLIFEITPAFIFPVIVSSVTSNLVFSAVYIDKEMVKMKAQGIMYVPYKSLEIMYGIMQSYVSYVASNHLCLQVSFLVDWADITLEKFVNPNISLFTSYGISALAKIGDGSLEGQNIGRSIFDIGENLLKTNSTIVIEYIDSFEFGFIDTINEYFGDIGTYIDNIISYIDNYLKESFLCYIDIKNYVIAFFNSYNMEPLLDFIKGITDISSIKMMFITMVASRIIRSIVFPDVLEIENERKKRMHEEEEKRIKKNNSDINDLITKLNSKDSSQQLKEVIIIELKKRGIIEHEYLPIQQMDVSKTHSSVCGRNLNLNNDPVIPVVPVITEVSNTYSIVSGRNLILNI